MTTEAMHKVMGMAADEAERAQEQYGNFASMHEAWGVLAEEFAELTEAIRLGQKVPNRPDRIEAEAIQSAAVCLRIAEQARTVLR